MCKNTHPEVTQVSDRFHLFKNLTEYSKDFLKKELDQKVSASLPIYKITSDNLDENYICENKINENRCLALEEKPSKALTRALRVVLIKLFCYFHKLYSMP
jgi:hypothetical protein